MSCPKSHIETQAANLATSVVPVGCQAELDAAKDTDKHLAQSVQHPLDEHHVEGIRLKHTGVAPAPESS